MINSALWLVNNKWMWTINRCCGSRKICHQWLLRAQYGSNQSTPSRKPDLKPPTTPSLWLLWFSHKGHTIGSINCIIIAAEPRRCESHRKVAFFTQGSRRTITLGHPKQGGNIYKRTLGYGNGPSPIYVNKWIRYITKWADTYKPSKRRVNGLWT